MPFDNVINHLNHAAQMHRSNALAAAADGGVDHFEHLVVEYDAAIRKLSDGQRCAVDVDGVTLVKNAVRKPTQRLPPLAAICNLK